MKPLLEIRNLSVFYGLIQALKGVSIQVKPGSIVSLVGANGAGKSTLMKTIIGIQPAKTGEILFKSENILGLKSHEIVQKGISQSPEGRQVFADMTVFQNLALGAFSKKFSSLEMKNQMEEVFAIFPVLKERMYQPAVTLSGGEQQMLAIGRALMIRPELLLLDEPSLGISPILTEKIFDILIRLKKSGTAILLAEQNAAMALEISDHGYVIELGEVIYQDAATSLMSNDVVRKAYLGV